MTRRRLEDVVYTIVEVTLTKQDTVYFRVFRSSYGKHWDVRVVSIRVILYCIIEHSNFRIQPFEWHF